MYKLNRSIITVILLFLSCFFAQTTAAQLLLTGQLRTKGELRDGYRTLETTGNQNATFIRQRSKLTFNYILSRVIFQTSIQDIGLRDQDALTITPADGASFNISPVDYLAIKIGSQELVYGNEHLLVASNRCRRHIKPEFLNQ